MDILILWERLNAGNASHVFNEDMIPLWTILYSIKNWEKKKIGIFFIRNPKIGFNMWHQIFPTIEFLFTTDSETPILCNELIAGSKGISNHFILSKFGPINPKYAIPFKSFIFNQLKLTTEYTIYPKSPRVLIINRKKSRILSIPEFKRTLNNITRNNITICESEFENKENFSQQIKIMNNYDIIIMVHGGALFNSFFIKNTCFLIEIYNHEHQYAIWMYNFYPKIIYKRYKLDIKYGETIDFYDEHYKVCMKRFSSFFRPIYTECSELLSKKNKK